MVDVDGRGISKVASLLEARPALCNFECRQLYRIGAGSERDKMQKTKDKRQKTKGKIQKKKINKNQQKTNNKYKYKNNNNPAYILIKPRTQNNKANVLLLLHLLERGSYILRPLVCDKPDECSSA
jgi:hypothetical protein